MRLRMIVTAFLIILLSAGISSKSEAAPWRGYYRHGWYHPHPVVGVYVAPVAPVVVGGYYGPHYYGHPYYRGYYRGGDGYRYRHYGAYHGHR
jgi:hypothetical protein